MLISIALVRVFIRGVIFCCIAVLGGCASIPTDPAGGMRVGERVDGGEVKAPHLIEISGVASSRRYPGMLWVHNDSGDTNRLYLIDRQGQYYGELWLDGCSARDWEDLATGPDPASSGHFLYVGDTGDNLGVFRDRQICRVIEPELTLGEEPFSLRRSAEVLRVKFADQPRDAEALLVDPLTHDIYIVTKREPQVVLYRLPYPQPFGGRMEVAPQGILALTGVSAGDVSPDGGEILLKTLSGIFYWRIRPGASWLETLQGLPHRVPYVREPQGEALAWAADGSGYFTLSEKVLGLAPHVYFYPRLGPLPQH